MRRRLEMIYRDFQDLKLSALGFGTMRFPVIDGDDAKIDEAAATKMIDYAMAHGINYYDTAWGYHAGNSEIVAGKALSKYPRDSYYLATKFPGYDLSNMGKAEEIFEEQLKKCGVEYFDFYLCHNLCEMNVDAYLDKSIGTVEYLIKEREAGRIKHLGFSVHGSNEITEQFLEIYGKYMEFGQIQLNYLDYTFQDAKGKIEIFNKYNIPVWVMEPVRGGKLASLAPEYEERLRTHRPDNAVDWAFRFLQSLPEVTMVLSGMSTMEQLEDNIRIFEEDKPLSTKEMDTLLGIAEDMLKVKTLPCTACHYCTSHCPQELDIPWLIELYNEHSFSDGGFIAPMAMMATPEEKQPSACIGCKSCEAVCPQQIKISEALADFAAKMKG